MSSNSARRFVLLLFAALLLLCIGGVLFQFTEVDAPVVGALRGVVPLAVKDSLRPLRAPQVLAFGPAYNAIDVAATAPITITFLTPITPSDAAIQISPNIRGTWNWDGMSATFTPAESWPLSTTVKVTVTREARSWLQRRAEKDFSWSFTTLAPRAGCCFNNHSNGVKRQGF